MALVRSVHQVGATPSRRAAFDRADGAVAEGKQGFATRRHGQDVLHSTRLAGTAAPHLVFAPRNHRPREIAGQARHLPCAVPLLNPKKRG